MRWVIVAVGMAVSAQAHAQDGAQMMTLAEVKQRRAELAGLFVRVENVTISGFTMARGGFAHDASATVRLDDTGMPQETVTYLERHCAKPGAAAAAPAGCRGALEFTVAPVQGAFAIIDAQFIPQR
ncbi:MAG: hypothetical protein Q8S58_00335 [Bosea sp. (in: a-proteobacteria)]|nr:hypothetical protein [Bosea sp. (in: a-proteobacteria)]